MITRRQALAGIAALSTAALYGPARAAKPYDPPGALVDAARREGRMVFYTASFTEAEQETINAFNKRFPFVRVEMVRASGGQLITRVKTEIAAGKLVADVVDHSDRALMKGIEDAFADYAPPNASDYLPDSMASPMIWPRITPGWCIATHAELLKTRPMSWMDLTKAGFGNGQIGQVIGPAGGTTWTRIMFERQVLGENYWQRQAATKPRLYPSSAPLGDALVRGEVLIAPLVQNVIFPKKRDGAPVEILFPPEGVPIVPYAAGIPKTARNPNAARLWLDWNLSDEGQTFSIRDQGNLTSLRNPPLLPDGWDPKAKVWLPKFAEFQSLYATWLEQWNTVYGYRQ